MIPANFEMYWNNTKQIISKRAVSAYFSKAQLLYSSIKNKAFKKFSVAVKTIDLLREPELSARNQRTVQVLSFHSASAA